MERLSEIFSKDRSEQHASWNPLLNDTSTFDGSTELLLQGEEMGQWHLFDDFTTWEVDLNGLVPA
jgi:hypothetical protein